MGREAFLRGMEQQSCFPIQIMFLDKQKADDEGHLNKAVITIDQVSPLRKIKIRAARQTTKLTLAKEIRPQHSATAWHFLHEVLPAAVEIADPEAVWWKLRLIPLLASMCIRRPLPVPTRMPGWQLCMTVRGEYIWVFS